jgi:hypothetical protein
MEALRKFDRAKSLLEGSPRILSKPGYLTCQFLSLPPCRSGVVAADFGRWWLALHSYQNGTV